MNRFPAPAAAGLLILLILGLPALPSRAAGGPGQDTQPGSRIAADPVADVEFRLSDRLADLEIRDGQVVLQTSRGPRAVEAEVFVGLLEARQRGESRGAMFRFLDITGGYGLIWIAAGFAGQLLFAGRMIVQWLASERRRQSVVPPVFWWLSLLGASMLLMYFIWRKDVVGVFGQALGWFIYARNLWLIRQSAAVIG